MRRIWIILLAIAMALVIALPAGAGKPDKPPKPPKPPTSVPIAVFINAEPLWTHEGDDFIHYKVTLQNKTSSDISDVAVQFTTTANEFPNPVSKWEFPDDAITGEVPANSSVWMKFDLYAHQFTEAVDCLRDDPEPAEDCALLATAEVLIYDEENDAYESVTQTEMSMPLYPEPPCDFKYDWVGEEPDRVVWTGTHEEPLSGVCIWTPGADRTGIWKVTLDPTPPRNPARPIGAAVAVRDGIPGNWCTLPDGSGGNFGTRWRVGDPPVVGEVYLPGTENILGLAFDPIYGGGTCLAGGAGGEYFMVGNPDSFYLRAEGNVTVEFVQEVTEDDFPAHG